MLIHILDAGGERIHTLHTGSHEQTVDHVLLVLSWLQDECEGAKLGVRMER